MTSQFMFCPEKILVNKERLTLEGISQYHINVKHNHWKYDVLTDIYTTIQIAQCIIYINSKTFDGCISKFIERQLSCGGRSTVT